MSRSKGVSGTIVAYPPLEPRVGREEHDDGEGGSGEDVEGVVVAADDCAERDGDREDEKEETCGQREAQQNERHGEGRGDVCAGEGDGVNATMSQNPTVEGSPLVY